MCVLRLDPVLPFRPRALLARPFLPILWLTAGLLGPLGIAPVVLGATPVGSEFQVNTYTTDWQGLPSVAVDADGDFVVVWASYGSAGSDTDYLSVQGQRYALTPIVPVLSLTGLIGLGVLLLGVSAVALGRGRAFRS